MNEGLIPRRYAKALLKFATERKEQDHVYGLMTRLSVSFEESPELQTALSNPFVKDADKCGLLMTAAGATENDSTYVDFLKLLSENGRLMMARDIALAYLDLYREVNKIYVVKVVSASPLTASDEERIKAMVLRHLNGGTMEYSSSVDPSLIGGFTVGVGNDRIDASISNELKQLRLNLLSK